MTRTREEWHEWLASHPLLRTPREAPEASPEWPDPPLSRIQSIHFDGNRPAVYGPYRWHVQYRPEYSHADKWFQTLEEALTYATEQNNLER